MLSARITRICLSGARDSTGSRHHVHPPEQTWPGLHLRDVPQGSARYSAAAGPSWDASQHLAPVWVPVGSAWPWFAASLQVWLMTVNRYAVKRYISGMKTRTRCTTTSWLCSGTTSMRSGICCMARQVASQIRQIGMAFSGYCCKHSEWPGKSPVKLGKSACLFEGSAESTAPTTMPKHSCFWRQDGKKP